jgi:hypothetical protein
MRGSNVRDGSGRLGLGPYWVDLSKLSPLLQPASARHAAHAMVM